jgi:hypothetical protein
MRVVKDRATCYGKLIATSVAVILIALDDVRNAFRLAARASNAVRPAKASELCSAFFIASELLDKLRKIHVCFEGFGWFFHKYA